MDEKKEKRSPESHDSDDLKPVKRPGLIDLSGLAEEEDPFSLQSEALKEALRAVENMGKHKKTH